MDFQNFTKIKIWAQSDLPFSRYWIQKDRKTNKQGSKEHFFG